MAPPKIDFEREFAKLIERLRQDPTLTKVDLVREALEWRRRPMPLDTSGAICHNEGVTTDGANRIRHIAPPRGRLL
ncbi:hypothetical protein LCGC14_0785830 [marine sediment metagenome]|uniref:Uncharacterized protein n=1 Tax=marine sediment metagenome TaxID=412755 RepID=A0A0F9SDY6_9ZZZZ